MTVSLFAMSPAYSIIIESGVRMSWKNPGLLTVMTKYATFMTEMVGKRYLMLQYNVKKI
ncbi:MAG: hypothetical protein ACERKN_06955 [Velocimicrobium sp.]